MSSKKSIRSCQSSVQLIMEQPDNVLIVKIRWLKQFSIWNKMSSAPQGFVQTAVRQMIVHIGNNLVRHWQWFILQTLYRPQYSKYSKWCQKVSQNFKLEKIITTMNNALIISRLDDNTISLPKPLDIPQKSHLFFNNVASSNSTNKNSSGSKWRTIPGIAFLIISVR